MVELENDFACEEAFKVAVVDAIDHDLVSVASRVAEVFDCVVSGVLAEIEYVVAKSAVYQIVSCASIYDVVSAVCIDCVFATKTLDNILPAIGFPRFFSIDNICIAIDATAELVSKNVVIRNDYSPDKGSLSLFTKDRR